MMTQLFLAFEEIFYLMLGKLLDRKQSYAQLTTHLVHFGKGATWLNFSAEAQFN